MDWVGPTLSIVLPGGVFVVLVTALVRTLQYQNRQITDGNLIPKATHERELAAAVQRGDDWKAAQARTETLFNTERDSKNEALSILAKTVEQLDIVKKFFSDVPTRIIEPKGPNA